MLSVSAPELRYIWRRSSSTSLLRFWSWLETLQGTTRRPELCQGTFNWLLGMTKN
ncbi:protein h2a.7 [Phtheirospermum japonicum]|uniref:Protein h2a.7 n=1 Tax=Phtheirospermum japonicum TaxID=374723 RepID=A0A830C6U1_9LAMI|nr:protein h2a.7 [Phtheirospermum japonicum]